MKRLSKSKIDYLTHVWNFAYGCRNYEKGACPMGEACWAYRVTKQFAGNYEEGFKPTILRDAFLSPLRLETPSRIGVCFMSDLFGDWFDPDMVMQDAYTDTDCQSSLKLNVFSTIKNCPQHQFLFLTKCPENLWRWGKFPDNAWVGVSCWNGATIDQACDHLATTVEAKTKYLSIEPLLEDPEITTGSLIEELTQPAKSLAGAIKEVDWVIIGAMTGTREETAKFAAKYPQLTPVKFHKKWSLLPPMDWVRKIITACDTYGIPVFIKSNILDCCQGELRLLEMRREYPRAVSPFTGHRSY